MPACQRMLRSARGSRRLGDGARLALLWLGLGCALGCKPSERAPLASDGFDSDEETEASTQPEFVGDGEDAIQYCGETSVVLPIKRPTFYFIVDASESMANPMPNSGGRNRAWAARSAIAEMLRVLGDRVDFGAATFPGDAEAACAPGEQVFAPQRGDPLDPHVDGGDTGPILQALMFNLAKMGPWGSTPTSATLEALRPTLEKLGPKTTAFLLTDGVPNCMDAPSCPSELCVGDIDRLPLDNGMVCGEDIQCCDPGFFPWLCLDSEATNANLRAMADAGIRTYVIGFPGSEAYAGVLDGMARAADTARADAESEYYRVADVADLAQTLTHLGQDLSLTCDITLDQPAKDRDRVSVLADGQLLEPDAEDGWRWDAEGVTLLGEACQNWREGRWDRIQVVEGCDFRVR